MNCILFAESASEKHNDMYVNAEFDELIADLTKNCQVPERVVDLDSLFCGIDIFGDILLLNIDGMNNTIALARIV